MYETETFDQLKLILKLNKNQHQPNPTTKQGITFCQPKCLIFIKLSGTMTMTMTFFSQIMSDLHQTFKNLDYDYDYDCIFFTNLTYQQKSFICRSSAMLSLFLSFSFVSCSS